ncbi:MAG: hypothetical protein REJ23_12915 [Brevundimonas sp.]|nr:hypothetical protein [Brevundimonas sp.]
MTRRKVWIALLVCGLATFAAVGLLEYRWRQSLLPLGVRAPVITYAKETTWGWGPGGNETGVIVYRMDRTSAERVRAGGIAWLEGEASRPTGPLQRPAADRRLRRTYSDWRTTPLEALWSGHGEHSCGREPGLGAYVDYDDFRCRVDPEVIARANRVLQTPGAFVARGQAGRIVIVAPAERLVIIAYNG